MTLSLATRRMGKPEEAAKVFFSIASLFVVVFCIAVLRQNSFALICIGLAGFGFFGFAGKAQRCRERLGSTKESINYSGW